MFYEENEEEDDWQIHRLENNDQKPEENEQSKSSPIISTIGYASHNLYLYFFIC